MLIAGFGADHLSWGFQHAALSGRYRVIAFDNRDCGLSQKFDAAGPADLAGALDRKSVV